MRISDWSSDVCSSDLIRLGEAEVDLRALARHGEAEPQILAAAEQIAFAQPDVAERSFRGREAEAEGELTGRLFLDIHLDQQLVGRSEEHTSELQSLMRTSYAVFCLKKKNTDTYYTIS